VSFSATDRSRELPASALDDEDEEAMSDGRLNEIEDQNEIMWDVLRKKY
jgi:hypothetical protein